MATNIETVTPEQALAILKTLMANDPKINKQAQEIMAQILSSIDIEEIAEEICSSLDWIDVEELWNRSDSQPGGGYCDPCEQKLFEEYCPKWNTKK